MMNARAAVGLVLLFAALLLAGCEQDARAPAGSQPAGTAHTAPGTGTAVSTPTADAPSVSLTLGGGAVLTARPLAKAGVDQARLVHVPIGWQQSEGGSFQEDVELFVLEGRLDIGDESLSRYSYLHLPAGTATVPWRSSHGAVLLLWAADSPLFLPLAAAEDGAATLLHRNYFTEVFETAALPGVDLEDSIPDFRAKRLRDDPVAGVAVWVTHGIGKRTAPTWQSFGAALDMFVLESQGEPVLQFCSGTTALRNGVHVGLEAEQVYSESWPDNGGYLLRLYRLQSGIQAPQAAECL